jgi:hypothetical protein
MGKTGSGGVVTVGRGVLSGGEVVVQPAMKTRSAAHPSNRIFFMTSTSIETCTYVKTLLIKFF